MTAKKTYLVKPISWLMSIAMLLGLLPTAAFAAAPPPVSIATASYSWGAIMLGFTNAADWANAITDVTVNGITYTKASSSYSVGNDTDFYAKDDYSTGGTLYIGDAWGDADPATCVVKATGYDDLTLSLKKTDTPYAEIVSGPVMPSVTGVTVTPGAVGVSKGKTQQFTAVVAGEHDPAQSVTWSVSGGVDGTAITENGLLTVAAEETAQTLVVTATSVVDPSKSGSATVTVKTTELQQMTAPSLTTDSDNYILTFSDVNPAKATVSVNDVPCTMVYSVYSLSGSGKYYVDGNRLYFAKNSWSVSDKEFQSGDVITIAHDGYETLSLKYTNVNGTVSIVPDDGQAGDGYTLHVRLVGYFEAALVGQKGYDAISGASTNITSNNNSNVEVQAALLANGATPKDGDWKPVKLPFGGEDYMVADGAKSATSISPAGSGMVAVYSPSDGSVTLAGTPAKAGRYSVRVTMTDRQGHSASSNALTFNIYDEKVTLAERLTLDNAVQMQDGKYIFDMEPWSIRVFGGTNETVTVPAEIKAWYGSHTVGTYGYLGHSVANNAATDQTLIIPSGCDLTMVNMQPLSGMKIIVENGGKLTLRETSVHGVIEVQRGGTFSMNYSGGKFALGASVNGQLILKDGAIIENAAIPSNTNFLPNGNDARTNVNPVVITEGDVTVRGTVLVRGDDAPTGMDPNTGKVYAGQTAFQVNGTLTIEKDATLAVYGGGRIATTSIGGEAMVLQGGTITGPGKLIAVGGGGFWNNGGNAVTGTGTINVEQVYLQAGNTLLPLSEPEDGVVPGKALNGSITVSASSNQFIQDGSFVRTNEELTPSTYWFSSTELPDLKQYIITTSGATASSLAVNSKAHKTAYTVGDALDVTGLTILVKKSDGSSETINVTSAMVSGFDSSSAVTRKTLTITYGTLTTTYDIVVSAPPLKPTQSSSAGGRTTRYTLTFHVNGGSAIAAISKGFGTTVDLTGYKPTKTGYTFDGWYSDSSLTSKVTSLKLTGNSTVYAKWTAVVAGSAVPFVDVPSGVYYEKAVKWAVDKGITAGTDESRFTPNGICTRAQAVTLLWRANGSPAPISTSAPFTDVDTGAYYYKALLWALEKGIIKGSDDTAFSPDMNCSRDQMVTMQYRAAGSPAIGNSNPFADVEMDTYYAKAVLWAVDQDITNGTGATTFSASDTCTRAQVVTFLYRQLG